MTSEMEFGKSKKPSTKSSKRSKNTPEKKTKAMLAKENCLYKYWTHNTLLCQHKHRIVVMESRRKIVIDKLKEMGMYVE